MKLKNYKLADFVLITIVLLSLDQLSKLYFFRITAEPVLNPGIAFSIPVPLAITIAISFGILSLISYLLINKKLESNIIWILLIAGGIGNLIDRIRIGMVIDFIQIGNFPVFNLADIYITLSALGIIIFYFFNFQNNGKQSN